MNTLVTNLSDADLISSTHALNTRSHQLDADWIDHLVEVDARGLYRSYACASMFTFCTQKLGFSEDAASNRITVARLCRRFPSVLESLRTGKVHLSGLRVLARHVTEENCREVISSAAGRSLREIEELVAGLAPKPRVDDSVRKLPTPRPEAPFAPSLFDLATAAAPSTGTSPVATAPTPAPVVSSPPRHRPPQRRAQPLAPDVYKYQFCATANQHRKIQELLALMRRRTGGDLAAAFELACDVAIAAEKKRRFGIGAKPRAKKASALPVDALATKPAAATSRHIPMANRRELLADQEELRCSFIGVDGSRCTERALLELDHIQPYAQTRNHSPQNLRLSCAAHNALLAEQVFGRELIARKRAAARAAAKSNCRDAPACGRPPGSPHRTEAPDRESQQPPARTPQRPTRTSNGDASNEATHPQAPDSTPVDVTHHDRAPAIRGAADNSRRLASASSEVRKTERKENAA